MSLKLSRLPKATKNLLMLASDLVVLPLALWSAAALRQGRFLPDPEPPVWAYLATVLIALPIFLRMGLYRAVVRYLEARAFFVVLQASALAGSLFLVLGLLFSSERLPLPTLLLYGVLSSGYVMSTRLLARQLLRRESGSQAPRQSVLVYGAGVAGRQLVQALRQTASLQPVAWIDDNPDLHGRNLLGLRIYPSLDLATLIRRMKAKTLIVAIPSLAPSARADLLERLEALTVDVRIVPGIVDLVSGEVQPEDLRPVSPEDLLGRDPVQLDEAGLRQFLRGRVVMVTGAGGSIGSELCRQIVAFEPSQLVLFDISEFALYSLREEFVTRWPDIELVCAVGDVKHADRVEHVMQTYQPKVVFHAAAYKHVPMMEEVNAWEAVRNNTFGTYVVGKAAMAAGVEKFVLISTDKAVNPTNVMGATKRLAEMVCQALHSQGPTHFEMVRFGNVLGSSGSVIPKFRDQIARGGPITVTHPDIVRYFMSIPEAAQLVLQAGCMGQGGEVFVLDMGAPVRIVDLARRMIRLSGHSDRQVGIEFTGLRPGEKLYEELLADSEFTRPTHHAKIRVARVAVSDEPWCDALVRWVLDNPVMDDAEVRAAIADLLPEYKPWSGA